MRTLKRALLAAAAAGVAVAGSLTMAGPAAAAVPANSTCGTDGAASTLTTYPTATNVTDHGTALLENVVKIDSGNAWICKSTLARLQEQDGVLLQGRYKWAWESTGTVAGGKCVDLGVAANAYGKSYTCRGTGSAWAWELTVAPPSSAPASNPPSSAPVSPSASKSHNPKPSNSKSISPKPSDSVSPIPSNSQAGSHGDVADRRACLDIDHGFTKFNNSVAFECKKVGHTWQWTRVSSGTSIVGTSCVAVDHNVRLFRGDVVHECAPASGSWKWVKVVTINGSTCSTGDHNFARLDSDDLMPYVCGKVGGTWKWTRTATLNDKICAATLHGVQVVNGGHAFECKTVPSTTATVVWKWCDVQIVTAPATVTVGSACDKSVDLKPVLINGVPCTCGQATVPTGTGTTTTPGTTTWQSPATPANAPDTVNAAETGSLPTTGAPIGLLVGLGVILLGAGLFVAVWMRNRRVRFTA